MARAAIPKKRGPRSITHTPGVPEVVQAAQIALLAMKAAKVKTWADFVARPADELRQLIVLTEDQQELLERHRRVLPSLQLSPVVTVYGCTHCGKYGLAGPAAISAKCAFTLQCQGAVKKASLTDYRKPAKKAD